LPEGEKRGFFQVVHGMTEHIGRYERFMRDMAENGYVCFGYDHLGHGNTASSDGELGYIAKKDGWKLLTKDVKVCSEAVFKEYGRGELPYILMGHSMGSFIARLATEEYVSPDRLVIMGTGGANPAADAGLAVIGVIKAIRGDKHISPLIDKLAFGSYNKRFGGGSAEDPKPWLTSDESIRKRYYLDKYCSFNFTVSAMGDLIRLMKYSNRADWYKSLPKSMPVLLVAGKEDPVGNYGKGIREVCDRLCKEGIAAEYIIYENARHEILNDFTYDRVKEDILNFCNKEAE
jgi:alpha-beta hydrolase superfamily lysophospholipase